MYNSIFNRERLRTLMKGNVKERDSAAAITPKRNYKSNKYVTKYRRTQNLVKKCKNISDQCNLDIILVIRDRKSDRCKEYHTSQEMTVSMLAEVL